MKDNKRGAGPRPAAGCQPASSLGNQAGRLPRASLATVAAVSLMFTPSCRRGVERTTEVAAVRAAALPLDPAHAAWNDAPEHAAKLLLQDLVDPRLMQVSTPEVLVRALTNGAEIAFRLSWADSTEDDLPGPGRFLDGCAIQIPSRIEADLPDPQMGQAGKPVEIAFWRADWQASVNGRPDDLRSLYPNATVDHYPFQAEPLQPGFAARQEAARRYAPAAAVGNRRTGPREAPVEDMIAEGPGTLAPAPSGASRAKGVYGKQGWSVVVVRPLPAGLAPRTRTAVAFAVWEGSHQEVGARKMRTGWIPLAVREAK
jgi:hypothetical protein